MNSSKLNLTNNSKHIYYKSNDKLACKREEIQSPYQLLTMGKISEDKLKHTKTFWWYENKSSFRGDGATADVYEGRNKSTGDRVAIKVFKRKSENERDRISRNNECENLKKLTHRNIVCLLGIELISYTREEVIIMEFCECNLLQFIKRIENSKGLEEMEFLTVLSDITCGMKYLRGKSYIHRDIKPGNVMRYVDDNQRVVYKIADFGSAKFLEPGEEFQSLHGTEEYLDPDVYAFAKYQLPAGSKFNEKIDLWSLGCTFYQAATAQVPLRPYEARRNPVTMMKMHREKPTGVISMYQTEYEGEIFQSKHLPHDCKLSPDLRALIEPILAGLLETEINLKMEFEDFFREVDNIMHKIRLPVIIVNELRTDLIYIQNHKSFEEFQLTLSKKTGINRKNMLIIWNSSVLTKSSSIDLFTINEENPLMVLDLNRKIENNSSIKGITSKIGKLMEKSNLKTLLSEFERENLNKICFTHYDIYPHMKKFLIMFKKCIKIPDILWEHFQKTSIKLTEKISHYKQELKNKSNMIKILKIKCNYEIYKNIALEIESILSSVIEMEEDLVKQISHYEDKFHNESVKKSFSVENFPKLFAINSNWDLLHFRIYERSLAFQKSLSKVNLKSYNDMDKRYLLCDRCRLENNIKESSVNAKLANTYLPEIQTDLNSFTIEVSAPLLKLKEIYESFLSIDCRFELLISEYDKMTQELIDSTNRSKDSIMGKNEEEIQNFSIRIEKNWATTKSISEKNRWIAVNIDNEGTELSESILITEDDTEEEMTIQLDQNPTGEEKKYEEEIESKDTVIKEESEPVDSLARKDNQDETESFKSNETLADSDAQKYPLEAYVEILLEKSRRNRIDDILEKHAENERTLYELIDSVNNSITTDSPKQT